MHVATYSFPPASNTFLITAQKKAIVDLGTRSIAALVPLGDVCCIILTHAHYDHTAALDSLDLTEATAIMMHEDDAQAKDKVSASHFFGAEAPQFRVDVRLKDNEHIDLGDVSLRVIHTPGHTRGSICLYEPESKSLFSGDTVFPYGSIGRTDLPGGSARDLVTSIKKLTELDVATLYPGHGPVTADNVNGQIRQSLNLARSAERFG